jgi:hypothetical protein
VASFWNSFLDRDTQRLADPGDPSMPYGPPLWSDPEQGSGMRSYDPVVDQGASGYLREFLFGADTYRNPDIGDVIRIGGPVQSAAALTPQQIMMFPCLVSSEGCGGGGGGARGFGGGGGGSGPSIFRSGTSSPSNLRPRAGEKISHLEILCPILTQWVRSPSFGQVRNTGSLTRHGSRLDR